MKINSLLEFTTPSSDPQNATSPAPKFGRSDKFLEDETVEESTTSGSVATVASPVGGMQRRGKGSMLQGIKTSAKFPNSKSVKEGVNPQDFDSDEDYYDAVRKSKQKYHDDDDDFDMNDDDFDPIDDESYYEKYVRTKNLEEKSKSQAQFRTMAAVAHNPEFAKKVGISQKVGKEFHSADRKQNYKDLPAKVDEEGKMSPISRGRRDGKQGKPLAPPYHKDSSDYHEYSKGWNEYDDIRKSHNLAPYNKKSGVGEAANPAQQAAIAIAKKKEQGVAEAGEWTKLPNGNWRNMHTGAQQSTPPKTKEPRRTMGLHASLEQHADDKMKELGHKFKPVDEARVGNRMSDISIGSPKIVHYKGKAVGEVGIDHEASPGNGPYYFHHYLTGKAYVGYDTKQQALADLKSIVMQVDAKELEEGPSEVIGLANFSMGGGIPGGQSPADVVDARGVIEETLPITKEKQKYIQAAKDVLKGADFDHVARVRNLDVEMLRKFVGFAHEKLSKGDYKLNRPNLEEQGAAESNDPYKPEPHDEFASDTYYDDPKDEGMSEEKQRLDPKCWTGYKKQGTKMKGGVRVNNCVPIEEAELTEEDMLANELFKQLELFKKAQDKGLGSKPQDKGISAKAKDRDIISKDNGEYNDEAGMADNNLETLKRAVDGIDELINTGDNLPEWCQEKIAVAKSMLVTVWDYMQSEEHSEVDEDWNKVNHRDKTDGMSRKAVKAYRRENPGSKLQTAVTTKPSKLKPGSKAAKRRKSFCARMSGNKGPMKDEKGRPTPKAKALRRWNCEE